MIRRAALCAAIGTLLLGAMYRVNNVLPILRNLDVVAPVEAVVVLEGVPALFSILDALGGQLAASWDADPAAALWRLLGGAADSGVLLAVAGACSCWRR